MARIAKKLLALLAKIKTINSYLPKELPFLLFIFLTVTIFLALISYDSSDLIHIKEQTEVKNYIGFLGVKLSHFFIKFLGLASFSIPVILLTLAIRTLAKVEKKTNLYFFTTGLLLLLFASTTLLELIIPKNSKLWDLYQGGGLLGLILAQSATRLISSVGTFLIASFLGFVGFLMLTNLTISNLLDYTKNLIKSLKSALEASADLGENYQENTSIILSPENFKNKALDIPLVVQQPIKIEPQKIESEKIESKKIEPKEIEIKKTESPSTKNNSSKTLTKIKNTDNQYTLPSEELLDPIPKQTGNSNSSGLTDKELEANARLLEKKLLDFGVEGQVVDSDSGPVITMYEYKPAPGIKISRIANLVDDLTMAMKASSIRIVAPLPKKAAIGIEIPNPKRQIVVLREVIQSEVFQKSSSPLTLVMGVNIMGQPQVSDLAKMPHLLIAGTTGSGKSVGLGAMIMSILYKASPQEVRFLMIDPKRIELTLYQDLPHLLFPVLSDPNEATLALKWAVNEMERRYKLLAEFGARNISSFNNLVQEKIDTLKAQGEKEDQENPWPIKLPYLVIIIDELADLMMVSAKEVETYITRLAQMARAAGMHLILATQRPSVDVLTGIIKANLPTRLSFQVSSKIDSRTILDQMGAEKLLGAGDMLFLPPGVAKITRLHGAYVSDNEIKRVTDFIKKWGPPDYLADLTSPEDMLNNGDYQEEKDEKYDEALELILKTQRASISHIQRHLRIGYNRAARIIEDMERDGVVGPSKGASPRDILID